MAGGQAPITGRLCAPTDTGFGEGSSPTVVGDSIIVPWDHEGPSKLFALDTRTGTTVWEVDRDEPTCWATPLVVADADGQVSVPLDVPPAFAGTRVWMKGLDIGLSKPTTSFTGVVQSSSLVL